MRFVKERSAALLDCASAVAVVFDASTLLLLALSGVTLWATTHGAASTLDKSKKAIVGLFIGSSKVVAKGGPQPDPRETRSLQLGDASGRLVASRLARGGDIGRAGRLEKVLGARNLLRRIAVDREKRAAVLHLTFIALGFVFRNAHSNQRAN